MHRTTIEPLDLQAFLAEDVSPKVTATLVAEFAADQLADVQASNEQALGHPTPYQRYVDGVPGAPLDRVKPDGTIVFDFKIESEVFGWIYDQLVMNSPVGSGNDPHIGLYSRSHALFADGVQIDPHESIPPADEYVFTNLTEYARLIEEGHSSQASSGVYQVIAAIADQKFADVAAVKFSFRAPFEGTIIPYVPIGRQRQKDYGDISRKRGQFAAGRVAASDRAAANTERNLRVPAIVIRIL